MNYLTAAQVLFLHARLIAETGGAIGLRDLGLRDLGLLEAAVARPQATFDGADLYPDRWAKAAALMTSLVQNHPFVDGNKRVGVTAAGIFLQRNGLRLTATNDEVEALALAVAQGAMPTDQIAAWFVQHTVES
ncbi:MAG: type II toxin-antitoxin system death-on-curing family toxin [Caldilinea sp.]